MRLQKRTSDPVAERGPCRRARLQAARRRGRRHGACEAETRGLQAAPLAQSRVTVGRKSGQVGQVRTSGAWTSLRTVLRFSSALLGEGNKQAHE